MMKVLAHLRQVLALLLLGTMAHDLVDAEVRVRTVTECNRCRHSRQLLNGDAMIEIRTAGATVLLCRLE